MIIQAFPSGPFATNAYVVACPETRNAAIIDPAPESFEPIAAFVAQQGFHVDKLLLTHSHWDHTADTAKFKAAYGMPIYIHKLDSGNLEQPGSDGLPCWIAIEGVKADAFFDEGDTLNIGEISLQVICTPGHTPGGVCFYSPQQGVLISGDTLFAGSIGNLSFATARPQLMWDSLAKLAKLPPETRVFPGHGPATTIGKETWLPDAKRIFGN